MENTTTTEKGGIKEIEIDKYGFVKNNRDITLSNYTKGDYNSTTISLHHIVSCEVTTRTLNTGLIVQTLTIKQKDGTYVEVDLFPEEINTALLPLFSQIEVLK